MMTTYDTEMTGQAIRALLDKTCRKYFTDKSVAQIILSIDKKQLKELQLIDSLHQSVLTSLQFEQYRRAVRYLQAFYLVCDKTFGDSSKKMREL